MAELARPKRAFSSSTMGNQMFELVGPDFQIVAHRYRQCASSRQAPTTLNMGNSSDCVFQSLNQPAGV